MLVSPLTFTYWDYLELGPGSPFHVNHSHQTFSQFRGFKYQWYVDNSKCIFQPRLFLQAPNSYIHPHAPYYWTHTGCVWNQTHQPPNPQIASLPGPPAHLLMQTYGAHPSVLTTLNPNPHAYTFWIFSRNIHFPLSPLLLIQVRSPQVCLNFTMPWCPCGRKSCSLCLETNLLGLGDYFSQKYCREKDKVKGLDYVSHKIYFPNQDIWVEAGAVNSYSKSAAVKRVGLRHLKWQSLRSSCFSLESEFMPLI